MVLKASIAKVETINSNAIGVIAKMMQVNIIFIFGSHDSKFNALDVMVDIDLLAFSICASVTLLSIFAR